MYLDIVNRSKQIFKLVNHLAFKFWTVAKSFLKPELWFCILISFSMVFLRLVSFDYHAFFELKSIPNHDMYQGASLFATCMHSIRLTGEIAWWNPISPYNGYAQYYQSFLSPLAPTSHHIVFIIWSQFIYFLNALNIHIPEYFQYLIVNYVIFTFLTFFGFSLFVSRIFRHRATILLVLIIYCFSGIGVWYSSWFYFQESFSLFFLLAAIIGILQSPSVSGIMLALTAVLIQATSINYWTVYNFWFLAILLVTYCLIYKIQLRRLLLYIKRLLREHKRTSRKVLALLSLVLLLWMIIIVSMIFEQSDSYFRLSVGAKGGYSIDQAYFLASIRTFMPTQIFNPFVLKPPQPVDFVGGTTNAHSVRYIGAGLLPFLCLIPAYRWGRLEKWLIFCLITVFAICLTPPFLLFLWDIFPFMDRIVHLFYFYTHFGQILIILLAGLAIEKVFWGKYSKALRSRFIVIFSSTTVFGILLFLCYQNFHISLRFAALVALVSVLTLQALLHGIFKNRKFVVALIILVFLADLTNYFWKASLLDQYFTANRGFSGATIPLNSEIQSALRQPWSFPKLPDGFEIDLVKNMPIENSFWPISNYLRHKWAYQTDHLPNDFRLGAVYGKSLEFYTPDQVALQVQNIDELKLFRTYPNVLLLQSARAKRILEESNLHIGNTQPDNITTAHFNYQWHEWKYNTFSFKVNSSKSGWLLVRQLYDPLWKITVDGKSAQVVRANYLGMALLVAEGQHIVQMDYRPLARSLYWPASLLLEFTLLTLMFISSRSSTVVPISRHVY